MDPQNMDSNPQNMDGNPQVTPFMTSGGVANENIVGPPFGLMDIGDSAEAYLFRVSLPGIRKNECKVKCDVQSNGIVHIRGEIVPQVGGLPKDSPGGFQTRVQQHASPGPFTVSFKLPGPVDPRLFSPNFRADGILEGVLMKPRAPNVKSEGGVKHNNVPSVKIDAKNLPPPAPPAPQVVV